MNKQLGFTVIEAIIVIVVISILAVGVYINWPVTDINIGAQAFQLVNDIRYTQALSMAKNDRFRLVRASATSYQILNSSGTAIILANGNTTAILNSGITFGAWTNLPNNLIVFNSKGIPYIDTNTPGTPLAATATIALTGTSQTLNVLITPETGMVSVQ